METKDRRRSERKAVCKAVDYVLLPSPTEEPLSGVIVDMSEHGLCIFTTEKLTEGQKIMLRNGAPQSEKTAVVRWGQKYQDLYYRIGLEFEEP
jgi:hypothetical protein